MAGAGGLVLCWVVTKTPDVPGGCIPDPFGNWSMLQFQLRSPDGTTQEGVRSPNEPSLSRFSLTTTRCH